MIASPLLVAATDDPGLRKLTGVAGVIAVTAADSLEFNLLTGRRRNAHAPDIQKLRGALDPNERGLLITTSGLERGARAEAVKGKREPVGLVDGEQLISLLLQHRLGVTRGSPEPLQVASLDASDEVDWRPVARDATTRATSDSDTSVGAALKNS